MTRSGWSEEMYRLSEVDPSRSPLGFDAYMAIIHPEDRDESSSIVQAAIEAGGDFKTLYRLAGVEGGERVIEGTGTVTARHRREGRVDGGHRARRHRRAPKPRGTTAPRGGVPPGAEAGGPRAALRRDRPRLQQRADGDPRLRGAGARPARRRTAPPHATRWSCAARRSTRRCCHDSCSPSRGGRRHGRASST